MPFKIMLILLPTGGGGGGGGFWTGSQNSRTLSPRVSKISDFSFIYAFWTHCSKISGKLICQGVAAIIYGTRGHEKYAIETFLFLFKMAISVVYKSAVSTVSKGLYLHISMS